MDGVRAIGDLGYMTPAAADREPTGQLDGGRRDRPGRAVGDRLTEPRRPGRRRGGRRIAGDRVTYLLGRKAGGKVTSRWTRTNRSLTLSVQIPPNATATVRVPLLGATGVIAPPGARLISKDTKHQGYAVTSGSWAFRTR